MSNRFWGLTSRWIRFWDRRNDNALDSCWRKCRTTTSFRPPTRGFGYFCIISLVMGLFPTVSLFLMKYDRSPRAQYSMTRWMWAVDSLQSIRATMCGWCKPFRMAISEVRLSLSFLLSFDRFTDLMATRDFSCSELYEGSQRFAAKEKRKQPEAQIGLKEHCEDAQREGSYNVHCFVNCGKTTPANLLQLVEYPNI